MCHHHNNPIDNPTRNRPVWENSAGTLCDIAKYHAAVAEAVFTVLDEVRASGL